MRVDLYQINGKIYFQNSHFVLAMDCLFEPPEWDKKLGSLIDLSNIIKNETGLGR